MSRTIEIDLPHADAHRPHSAAPSVAHSIHPPFGLYATVESIPANPPASTVAPQGPKKKKQKASRPATLLLPVEVKGALEGDPLSVGTIQGSPTAASSAEKDVISEAVQSHAKADGKS